MNIKDLLSTPCELTVTQKITLAYCAGSLSEGDTVVEIGTFRGGSARIMSESTRATVHTIDVFPNADEALLGPDSRVKRFIGDAQAFADANPECRIDFLFVDGDHSFHGAYHDFNALAPLLAPDAVIAFHDYTDSYPGVRILCDGLARNGAIRDSVAVEGMLLCRNGAAFKGLTRADLEHGVDCFLRFLEERPKFGDPLGFERNYAELIDGLGSGWKIVGKGGFGRYMARFFSLRDEALLDSREAEEGGRYVVCSHYKAEITDYLTGTAGVAPENIVLGEPVLSFGMYEDLLRNNGRGIASLAHHDAERLLVEVLAGAPESALAYLFLSRLLVKIFLRTANI